MTIYSLDLLLSRFGNQSVVPCPVLTVASWPAYRFLRRQVRWSGIPISFRICQFLLIHTVKGYGIVNKAEVDVFLEEGTGTPTPVLLPGKSHGWRSLELSCFYYDPMDVGNLISGSSAFSKSVWTSGSSWFMYCWSLTWRIFSIILLVCEMSAIVQ